MGIWFEPFQADRCCLCGSGERLTGEHKIKASALRNLFGNDAMVIGKFDGESQPRNAQGPKFKAFHFAAQICEACNSAATQEADREFDRFHAVVRSCIERGDDPAAVFDEPRYAVGSAAYLNVFRYFAKLLACHVAESGGPRAMQLTSFARGDADRNVVQLYIGRDPVYADYAELSGEHAYAAHGGLIVPMNKNTRLPTCFRTSLSVGPVRYLFWVRFAFPVSLALKLAHPAFFEKCQLAFDEAVRNPMTEDQLRRRGI